MAKMITRFVQKVCKFKPSSTQGENIQVHYKTTFTGLFEIRLKDKNEQMIIDDVYENCLGKSRLFSW